jgi:hypothetical protein
MRRAAWVKNRGATNHFLLAGLRHHWSLFHLRSQNARQPAVPAVVAASAGRVVGRVEGCRRVPPWLAHFPGLGALPLTQLRAWVVAAWGRPSERGTGSCASRRSGVRTLSIRLRRQAGDPDHSAAVKFRRSTECPSGAPQTLFATYLNFTNSHKDCTQLLSPSPGNHHRIRRTLQPPHYPKSSRWLSLPTTASVGCELPRIA